ncbi:hypothetical protein CBR_g17094 [Chara braunii]|uniref:DUF659 domain-containing protein n=1 Tax=Chara braunii TaxID=69332 RepID=A0A388KUL2_CHABU|nr:hypothetical protein CBR_g17094 [Chara braunii]|eukprot:GBG73754.1 hypothetical protein CBR_g17094 [Chara braunii]
MTMAGNRVPFEPETGADRERMLSQSELWKWADRGQKVMTGTSHSSWRLRCRLCNKEFIGTLSKVVKHLTQPSVNARCPHTTGEILAVIRSDHPKVPLLPASLAKLNDYYKEQGRPPVVVDAQDLAPVDVACVSGEVGTSSTAADGGRDTGSTVGEGSALGFDSASVVGRGARSSRGPDIPEEIAEHLRGPVLAAARPPRPPSSAQQSSLKNFIVDELQREFDQAVASFFFENAIAFNVARSDSYKNMKRIMNSAARSRKMLWMPGYNHLTTKALPSKYKDVDKDLDKIREPWDVTGLTLMTDGTTTTSNRPVINFIAAGDSGAVMVRSVDMEGKDKSAPALARMWVEVIRELGVHRVNVICTDSAQVNISAKKILENHDDPAIRSISWVPCACHVVRRPQAVRRLKSTVLGLRRKNESEF